MGFALRFQHFRKFFMTQFTIQFVQVVNATIVPLIQLLEFCHFGLHPSFQAFNVDVGS